MRTRRPLVALIIAAMVALFFVVASTVDLVRVRASPVVLGLLTGLAVAWFLDISRYFFGREAGPIGVISFDVNRWNFDLETVEHQVFGESIDIDYLLRRHAWERHGYSREPFIMLAKVRLDLDSCLYRLQNRSKLFFPVDVGTTGELLDVLSRHNILPQSLKGVVRDIVDAFDRACRGYEIGPEDIRSILISGLRVIYILDHVELNDSPNSVLANSGPQADG